MALDQLQLSSTAPFFETFFAKDRIGHGLVKLDEQHSIHSAIANKSADSI
jgi:hypothetical protein